MHEENKEEKMIIGRIFLNGKHAPYIRILADNIDGMCNRELILLRKVETRNVNEDD